MQTASSQRPRVYVSRKLFAAPFDRIRSQVELIENPQDVAATEASLMVGLQEADILVATLQCPVTAQVIASAPRLKMIANVGVGTNNIDLTAARARGIQVSNTPDVLTEATADLAWSLLMAAGRQLSDAERWIREGQWNRWAIDLWLGADFHQKTIGIFGFGRIGQAVARRSLGFDMRVVYHNRQPVANAPYGAQWVSKEELLEQSDHVVVVLPLTPETKGMIGAKELARMPSHAILVNIGRGGIVDDRALAAALQAGTIAGAGLDVFENEPAIYPELLQAPRLVCTPHIGSATLSTRMAMVHIAVDNILAFLNHQELPQKVS